jgi:hypothetical protein
MEPTPNASSSVGIRFIAATTSRPDAFAGSTPSAYTAFR